MRCLLFKAAFDFQFKTYMMHGKIGSSRGLSAHDAVRVEALLLRSQKTGDRRQNGAIPKCGVAHASISERADPLDPVAGLPQE